MIIKDLYNLLTVKRLILLITVLLVGLYCLYFIKPNQNNLDLKVASYIDIKHTPAPHTELTTGTISRSSEVPVSPTLNPKHVAAPSKAPAFPNKELTDSNENVIDTQVLLQYIHKQCDERGIRTIWRHPELQDLQKDNIRLGLVVEEYNILYSSNPKSGSTSFKKYIKRLKGDQTPFLDMHASGRGGSMSIDQYMTEHKMTYKETTDKLYTLGFIRNPMTRIISGYRDKVLRKDYKKIRKELDAIAKESSEKETEESRFHNFIALVTQGKIHNMHFSPQWEKMRICSFPYKLLGQTETTTQQIAMFQKATGTQDIEFPGSRTEDGRDKVSSVELTHRYFDTMPAELLEKFYEFYKLDFELTGYTKLHEPGFPYININR